MTKIYVLDTNVLLNDPAAIYAFNEHKVIIPMTVLEELDDIKERRDKDVSREARIAIGAIDRLLADATTRKIQEGVEIYTSLGGEGALVGTLAIFPDQKLDHDPAANFLTRDLKDNKIINVALSLQYHNPDDYVCLVTKDINMRLKAKGSGMLHVEDYRREKILDDIDLLAKGHDYIEGSFWDKVNDVETIREGKDTFHHMDRDLFPEYFPNMFVHDDQDFVGMVSGATDTSLTIQDLNKNRLMHQEIWGLKLVIWNRPWPVTCYVPRILI